VADGSADLAIHQISEILPVAGAVLVGPLPPEIQNWTAYVCAPSPAAGEVAKGFLARLAGPEGRAVLRARGMEPPGDGVSSAPAAGSPRGEASASP